MRSSRAEGRVRHVPSDEDVRVHEGELISRERPARAMPMNASDCERLSHSLRRSALALAAFSAMTMTYVVVVAARMSKGLQATTPGAIAALCIHVAAALSLAWLARSVLRRRFLGLATVVAALYGGMLAVGLAIALLFGGVPIGFTLVQVLLIGSGTASVLLTGSVWRATRRVGLSSPLSGRGSRDDYQSSWIGTSVAVGLAGAIGAAALVLHPEPASARAVLGSLFTFTVLAHFFVWFLRQMRSTKHRK